MSSNSPLADIPSETNSASDITLKENTFEKGSDMGRRKNYYEIPTDAVFVSHQKQMSNPQYLKSSVEVTEAAKTKEKMKMRQIHQKQ